MRFREGDTVGDDYYDKCIRYAQKKRNCTSKIRNTRTIVDVKGHSNDRLETKDILRSASRSARVVIISLITSDSLSRNKGDFDKRAFAASSASLHLSRKRRAIASNSLRIPASVPANALSGRCPHGLHSLMWRVLLADDVTSQRQIREDLRLLVLRLWSSCPSSLMPIVSVMRADWTSVNSTSGELHLNWMQAIESARSLARCLTASRSI
jgi:hypothetical protein